LAGCGLSFIGVDGSVLLFVNLKITKSKQQGTDPLSVNSGKEADSDEK